MKPRAFWRLHPIEFYWLLDARRPRTEYAGGMSEDEVANIYEDAYGEPDV